MAKIKLNKKLLIAVVMATLLLALLLAGCSNNTGGVQNTEKVAVTSIKLESTLLYMAPYGEPSKYKLQPIIAPTNATNKKVIYQLLDAKDGQYVQISAKGEIVAQKEKKEGDIKLRIFSQDNRAIFIDVAIWVEIAAVTKISFAETELIYHMGQEKQLQIKPIFTPAHAVDGRDVTYKSLNPDVFDVGTDGTITPKKVGIASVEVATPADTTEKPIKSYLKIEIRYAPLSYKLNLTSQEASLKQIIKENEPIVFTLLQVDENCDPNPKIRWYIDKTAIDQDGITDNKIFNYTPSNFPYGEYVIRAEVTDASTQTTEYTSQPLFIYHKLTDYDLTLQRNASEGWQIGDLAQIIVTKRDKEYPPESYNWYLKRSGDIGNGTKIANVASDTFNYELKQPGSYLLVCEPIVKGVPCGIIKSVAISNVGSAPEGQDIFGVYIDGAIVGDTAVPHIKWEALPYSANYELQININDTIYTVRSSNPEYQAYFTGNGFMIPSSIATLEQNFKVRIKTERHSFCDWNQYNGSTISTEYYPLLKDFVSNYNGYVVNMEELGELINYVSQFRPTSIYEVDIKEGGTRTGYKVEFYTDMWYVDNAEMKKMYPIQGSLGTSTEDKDSINAFSLIAAAFNTYGDSGEFSMTYSVDKVTKIISAWINFKSDLPSEFLSTGEVSATKSGIKPHYAEESRNSNTLPIDSNPNAMQVATSNQLYIAISSGYKPVPVAGSQAQTIYNAARAVSKRICNDNMTDAQKAHAIYDYLTCEIYYDYDLVEKVQEIQNDGDDSNNYQTHLYEGFYLEGVFLRNKAVCDGIAKAFNTLCWMEGIRSTKITGMVGEVGHAWNKVVIGGEWYGVDATWGSDTVGYNNGALETQHHQYMFVTDAILNDSARRTYGKYEPTATNNLDTYYGQEVMRGINPTIISDAEVTALVQNYMLNLVEVFGETAWLEIKLDQKYAESIKGIKGQHIGALSQAACGTRAKATVLPLGNIDNHFVIVIKKI